MSFNKKLLAGVIAGLLISANASAQVTLGGIPRDYAVELTKPVVLTDAAGDDVNFALGYNFSANEVRYGRYECSSNITIASPVVTSSATTQVTVGAVNGAGTPALFFSLTATATPGVTAGVTLNVGATNTLLDNNNVNCAFSIYDQPSQAQAGGLTGRIYTTNFHPVIRSVPSFAFTTVPGQAVANVEAVTGAYTNFVTNGNFGSLSYGLVTAPPRRADGILITMADLFAAGTAVRVAGDFSAIAPLGVQWNAVNANTVAAGVATFSVGATARTGILNYVPSTTVAILESTYTATLIAVANAGYTIANVGPLNAGAIVRNGTQLQAPLAQVPNGYISRMVLTNTGNLARPYVIAVQGETGNTISTANLTGNVPANGTVVVELPTVLTGFTAAPRATLNVTIAGPNNQIQGLYQIVNPAAGSISNHVMVRPGSN